MPARTPSRWSSWSEERGPVSRPGQVLVPGSTGGCWRGPVTWGGLDTPLAELACTRPAGWVPARTPGGRVPAGRPTPRWSSGPEERGPVSRPGQVEVPGGTGPWRRGAVGCRGLGTPLAELACTRPAGGVPARYPQAEGKRLSCANGTTPGVVLTMLLPGWSLPVVTVSVSVTSWPGASTTGWIAIGRSPRSPRA